MRNTAPGALLRRLLLAATVLLLPVAAAAGTVTVTWDPNREVDVAGYVLFYGTASGVYAQQVDVGHQTSWQSTDLRGDVRYYFAVRAYDAARVFSPYSIEVSAVVSACGLTLSATHQSFDWSQMAGEVLVTTGGARGWQATTTAPWISIPVADARTGSGALAYTLEPNTSGAARTGEIRIGDAVVTVLQGSAACRFTVDHRAQFMSAVGGQTSVTVATAPACAWTAVSDAAWVSVSIAASHGAATLDLAVAPNSAAIPRTATVLVAGQPVQVLQAARSTITITSPTAADRLDTSEPTLVLSGTASAGAGVAAVTWSVDGGATGTATGTKTWTSGEIVLSPGTSLVTVTATAADGSTATDTLAVTLTRSVSYFAEGATGVFFDLDIALANPNDAPAPVTLTFLKEDGSAVRHSLELAPRSRATVAVDELPGLEATSLSTIVESPADRPVAAERTMRWGAGQYGAHGAMATEAPRTSWYFAEGSEGFFETYFLFANPNAQATSIDLRFLTEAGTIIRRRYQMTPTSRLTVDAGSIAELEGRSFATVVDAALPVLAERSMYFGQSRFWEGGHASAGVAAPATSWFHAEGATGPFFDSFVLVANPQDQPATVTFTYLLTSGETVVRTSTVAANSRLTVDVERVDPRLANTSLSIAVRSDRPIVSERSMFWGGTTPDQWVDAHNSFGVTETGTRWIVADGRVGGQQGYETYLLIANVEPAPAVVALTFLRETGAPIVKTVEVAPTSRFNAHVATLVPELAGTRFAVTIESLNLIPIAVEKAMYSTTSAHVWDAGTNVAAQRLR